MCRLATTGRLGISSPGIIVVHEIHLAQRVQLLLWALDLARDELSAHVRTTRLVYASS